MLWPFFEQRNLVSTRLFGSPCLCLFSSHSCAAAAAIATQTEKRTLSGVDVLSLFVCFALLFPFVNLFALFFFLLMYDQARYGTETGHGQNLLSFVPLLVVRSSQQQQTMQVPSSDCVCVRLRIQSDVQQGKERLDVTRPLVLLPLLFPCSCCHRLHRNGMERNARRELSHK